MRHPCRRHHVPPSWNPSGHLHKDTPVDGGYGPHVHHELRKEEHVGHEAGGAVAAHSLALGGLNGNEGERERTERGKGAGWATEGV